MHPFVLFWMIWRERNDCKKKVWVVRQSNDTLVVRHLPLRKNNEGPIPGCGWVCTRAKKKSVVPWTKWWLCWKMEKIKSSISKWSSTGKGAKGTSASYLTIASFDCSEMVNWDIEVEMTIFLFLLLISYMYLILSFFLNGMVSFQCSVCARFILISFPQLMVWYIEKWLQKSQSQSLK